MTDVERPFYAILGVTSAASQAEIKRAYRRLVNIMHPDKGGDPEQFVELTKAYNVLMDPKARDNYDLSGDTGDFNPLAFQMEVIDGMRDAFKAALDQTIREGLTIEDRNFITLIRNIVDVTLGVARKNESGSRRVLRELHALRKRIKRTGEERNVFLIIIDDQVKQASAALDAATRQIRVGTRIAEELANYRDVHEVIRTMQAGRYPGQPMFEEMSLGDMIMGMVRGRGAR